MATMRQYEGTFKAKVALEAIKAEKTLSEIASEYGVHTTQIIKWKKRALEELPNIFNNKKESQDQQSSQKEEELYKQIGQLTVELDWVKKKSKLLY